MHSGTMTTWCFHDLRQVQLYHVQLPEDAARQGGQAEVGESSRGDIRVAERFWDVDRARLYRHQFIDSRLLEPFNVR